MARSSQKTFPTRQRKKWLTKLQENAAKKKLGAATSPSLNILLDTNVWYSAIVYGGTSEDVINFCLKNYQIVFSEELIAEIIDRLKRKARAPYRWLRLMRLALENCGSIVQTRPAPDIVRDPKDIHILIAAKTGGCDFIITGDKDLLELEEYEDIVIVTPSDFLRLIQPKNPDT